MPIRGLVVTEPEGGSSIETYDEELATVCRNGARPDDTTSGEEFVVTAKGRSRM